MYREEQIFPHDLLGSEHSSYETEICLMKSTSLARPLLSHSQGNLET